jgi:hypothetical protein
MEQLKQILVIVAMGFCLVYTIIVVVALLFAAFGIGKIKKTPLDWVSVGIVLLWLSGLYLWLKYFNLI